MLAGAVLLAILLPRGSVQAAEFTPAQRAEIVQILRNALTADPSILEAAIAALQAKEQALRQQAVLAARASLSDAGDPIAGNPHGSVTIVEFFDVRCPFCRELEPELVKLLRTDHDVRILYKDLPILGAPSILASRALLAAQQQGGYDRLRALLMQAPPDITPETIRAAATRAGLDWPRLEHDMSAPVVAQRLKADQNLARAIGVEGTPTLVVGADLIAGAVDFAALKQAVAKARHERPRISMPATRASPRGG